MNLTLNGKPFSLTAPSPTVSALIDQLGLTGRPVAVEVNHQLIRKREHDSKTLHEGDTIELVTLVGGG